MNYNILSYLLYLPTIFFITIKVGWLFYKNGEIFLASIFINNPILAKNTNNLLLLAYYLTNLGYAVITIAYWDKISNIIDLINTLSSILGKIIVILALLHYNNIFWLKHITKSNTINQ